jgi:hypothetical protein
MPNTSKTSPTSPWPLSPPQPHLFFSCPCTAVPTAPAAFILPHSSFPLPPTRLSVNPNRFPRNPAIPTFFRLSWTPRTTPALLRYLRGEFQCPVMRQRPPPSFHCQAAITTPRSSALFPSCRLFTNRRFHRNATKAISQVCKSNCSRRLPSGPGYHGISPASRPLLANRNFMDAKWFSLFSASGVT